MANPQKAPAKPERLLFGDTVGLVAPGSPPPDPRSIDRAIEALESLGFEVKLGRSLRRRFGFLAGTDRERAGDVMRMFKDKEVKAIFCLRGGYGTSRILGRLDYEVIRRNPKVFMGYSDITALHCALLTKANLVTFHGPMPHSELMKPDLPTFTLKGLHRTLMEIAPPGNICRGYTGMPKSLRRGMATGRLVGGNLSLLCTTLATPYQPEFKGRILFLEDIDERPYRFDRMLTHLLNAGLLQQVAGVAVGINVNCRDAKPRKRREYRQTVEDVLKERLLPLRIPVVTELPFGHVLKNATLPVGVEARLDGNRGDLVILEAGVE